MKSLFPQAKDAEVGGHVPARAAVRLLAHRFDLQFDHRFDLHFNHRFDHRCDRH